MDIQIEQLKASIAQALAVIVAAQAQAGDPTETLLDVTAAICGLERGNRAAPMLRELMQPSLAALSMQSMPDGVDAQIRH